MGYDPGIRTMNTQTVLSTVIKRRDYLVSTMKNMVTQCSNTMTTCLIKTTTEFCIVTAISNQTAVYYISMC